MLTTSPITVPLSAERVSGAPNLIYASVLVSLFSLLTLVYVKILVGLQIIDCDYQSTKNAFESASKTSFSHSYRIPIFIYF